MEKEIAVSITSQDMLSLKQSCQTIILAYKQYCGTIVKNDETALYPLMADQVNGLKGDTRSGIDSLDSYSNMNIDEMERPESDINSISSYKDIDNIKGNYTISQSIYDEAQSDLKPIFAGLKNREITSAEAIGSNFIENSGSKGVQKTISNPVKEKINTENNTSNKSTIPQSSLSLKEEMRVNSAEQGITQSNNKKGRYRNVISEDCIPCALRLGDLNDIEVDLKVLNPLTEMAKRYKELIDSINHLFSNTDIENDLCSLLDFLGAQCIPDLVAIIALLNAMMLKDLGVSLNLEGAFMMFIGPFFTPMLSGLNGVLDQYMQAIMQPVDCVLNALDTQLAKLDINKAIDKMEVRNIIEHRRKEGAMRRELEQLKEREAYLKEAREERGGDSPPPRILGGIRLETDSETGEQKKNGIDVTHLMNMGGNRYLTIDQELRKIKSDIRKLTTKYKSEYGDKGSNNIEKMIKKSQDPYKSSARKATAVPGKAKDALQQFRTSFSDGLQELRVKILNGKRMVNDTLTMISEELMRLILGRASTSEGMINGLYEIQKTIRLISLVSTLIKLAEKGKLCKNRGSGNTDGDPSAIIGNYLMARSSSGKQGNYNNIYEANDSTGNKFLLVTPPDSTLKIYGNSENDSENLLTKKTTSIDGSGNSIGYSKNASSLKNGTDKNGVLIKQLSDTDEIKKLNSQGIMKNIGDITDKKIVAFVPDLGVEVPVQAVVIKECSKMSYPTKETTSKIEKWAN